VRNGGYAELPRFRNQLAGDGSDLPQTKRGGVWGEGVPFIRGGGDRGGGSAQKF